MRTQNDVLEVTKRIAADVGCNMADVAAAVDRQQSALCRQLANNPTWRTVSEVAWALGLGLDPQTGEGKVEVQWLLIPASDYERYRGTYFVLNRMCPAVQHRSMRENRKLTRYATWGRGPDYDPTDKSHLSQVYPSKALAGAGPEGAPIDSRFIEAPAPEPLHGKTSQGPGGAARGGQQKVCEECGYAYGPTSCKCKRYIGTETKPRSDADAIGDTLRANNMEFETPEQRQQRLSEGAPQGYRLSAKALADAPRSTLALWQQAGWDIDKLIHHGYLEVDPANPPANAESQAAQPDPAFRGETTYADPIEARRLQASHGCPDGWILSDKALEVSDDVTYDKLARAMDVDQLKEEKYLVPRAWLGYE